MKKRILSFLLMLVMVLSLVPTMATATAAAESEEEITADDLYVTDGLVQQYICTLRVHLNRGDFSVFVYDLILFRINFHTYMRDRAIDRYKPGLNLRFGGTP